VTEPITLGGIGALIVSGVAMWIREWRRGRNEKTNGTDLKEIKDDVKSTMTKVNDIGTDTATIKTDVKGIKEHCTQTTQRFEKAINDNRKNLFEIATKKDKK